MTPSEFIKKWKAANLKERSAAQEHFLDLCRLIGEQTPAKADPEGEWYCFERGASKLIGGDGWADVWKRSHFGWEHKGKHKDLKADEDIHGVTRVQVTCEDRLEEWGAYATRIDGGGSVLTVSPRPVPTRRPRTPGVPLLAGCAWRPRPRGARVTR
jgi:hypothetical protein